MAYSRMGFGGVVLIILLAALKIFNAYHRMAPNDSPGADAPQYNPDDYAQRQRESMEREMARQQQYIEDAREQSRQQTQAIFEAQRQASQERQQRQQAIIEQSRRNQESLLERHRQTTTPPTHTPPSRPTTHSTTRPSQPSPQQTVQTPPQPEPQAEALPAETGVQPFAFSPKPDDALLEQYETWEADGSYDRFLGEAYTFGDWRFQPSKEFALQRTNSRTAKWGAGKAGIGLDADLFKLYPRDHGMTCPVHEDTQTRQVFRLGRREIRARGNAEVSHLESNGLCIWRIHTPADEGDRFGSCYYMVIQGEQDAILFTARYDAKKPEQIAAFDAVVNTLEYVQSEE